MPADADRNAELPTTMHSKIVGRVAVALASTATATFAYAHPGHDVAPAVFDFAVGFSHPFGGWDHVVAAVAVGFWATRLGGHARWLTPVGFLSGMILGLVFGRTGFAVLGIGQGIAASLLGLGFLIANVQKAPVILGAVLMAVFAVFHGAAHAAIPHANLGLPIFGIVAGTMCVHLIGLAVAQVFLPRFASAKNYVGWSVAAAAVCSFAT